MSFAWRPLWGYYALMMKITRVNWIFNLIVGVVIPVITFMIYSQRSPENVLVRVLVGNIMFAALMMIARGPANDMVWIRVSGSQHLLATSGLTRTTYLIAVGLVAVTFAVCPAAVMGIGLLLSDVASPVSVLWLGPFALAIVCMIATSYYIASIVDSGPAVALASNLMVTASLAFCPLLYPVERVPELIRPAIALLPPTLSAETMTAAWVGRPMVWWHLPLLALWTIVFFVPGVRGFKWTEAD